MVLHALNLGHGTVTAYTWDLALPADGALSEQGLYRKSQLRLPGFAQNEINQESFTEYLKSLRGRISEAADEDADQIREAADAERWVINGPVWLAPADRFSFCQAFKDAGYPNPLIIPEEDAVMGCLNRDYDVLKPTSADPDAVLLILDLGAAANTAVMITSNGAKTYSAPVGASVIDHMILALDLQNQYTDRVCNSVELASAVSEKCRADTAFLDSLLLKTRELKETYFSNIREGKSGAQEITVPLSRDFGGQDLVLYVNDPLILAAAEQTKIRSVLPNLAKDIVQDRTWSECFKGFLEETVNLYSREGARAGSGDPKGPVLLTGGAVNMPFAEDIIRDFFPHADLYMDSDPGLGALKGLRGVCSEMIKYDAITQAYKQLINQKDKDIYFLNRMVYSVCLKLRGETIDAVTRQGVGGYEQNAADYLNHFNNNRPYDKGYTSFNRWLFDDFKKDYDDQLNRAVDEISQHTGEKFEELLTESLGQQAGLFPDRDGFSKEWCECLSRALQERLTKWRYDVLDNIDGPVKDILSEWTSGLHRIPFEPYKKGFWGGTRLRYTQQGMRELEDNKRHIKLAVSDAVNSSLNIWENRIAQAVTDALQEVFEELRAKSLHAGMLEPVADSESEAPVIKWDGSREADYAGIRKQSFLKDFRAYMGEDNRDAQDLFLRFCSEACQDMTKGILDESIQEAVSRLANALGQWENQNLAAGQVVPSACDGYDKWLSEELKPKWEANLAEAGAQLKDKTKDSVMGLFREYTGGSLNAEDLCAVDSLVDTCFDDFRDSFFGILRDSNLGRIRKIDDQYGFLSDPPLESGDPADKTNLSAAKTAVSMYTTNSFASAKSELTKKFHEKWSETSDRFIGEMIKLLYQIKERSGF